MPYAINSLGKLNKTSDDALLDESSAESHAQVERVVVMAVVWFHSHSLDSASVHGGWDLKPFVIQDQVWNHSPSPPKMLRERKIADAL